LIRRPERQECSKIGCELQKSPTKRKSRGKSHFQTQP
jgi:hypothetical protein